MKTGMLTDMEGEGSYAGTFNAARLCFSLSGLWVRQLALICEALFSMTQNLGADRLPFGMAIRELNRVVTANAFECRFY